METDEQPVLGAAKGPGVSMAHIPDYIWLDTAQTPERDY